MWINEYVGQFTYGGGIVVSFALFLVQLMMLAYGDYFIKIKHPAANGFVNFLILCGIFFISGLVIYLLSMPFYDPTLNDMHVYFLSIIFYVVMTCIIILLIYAFFYKLGDGA